MADQYKFVCDLSIGTIFSDLNNPLTQISRSHQYSMLNITITIEDKRHIYNGRRIGTHMQSIEWCHFQ